MDAVVTCPLGSVCEEIKDNKLHRCAWYVKLVGKDPQSNKEFDDWRCAIAWNPIMNVEVAQTNRRISGATESFRNEMVKGQNEFNNILKVAVDNSRRLISG